MLRTMIFLFLINISLAQSLDDIINEFKNDIISKDSIEAIKKFNSVASIYNNPPAYPVPTNVLNEIGKFYSVDTIKKFIDVFVVLQNKAKRYHQRNNYYLRNSNYLTIQLDSFEVHEKNIVTAIYLRTGSGNPKIIDWLLWRCEKDRKPIINFIGNEFELPIVPTNIFNQYKNFENNYFWQSEKLKELNNSPFLFK